MHSARGVQTYEQKCTCTYLFFSISLCVDLQRQKDRDVRDHGAYYFVLSTLTFMHLADAFIQSKFMHFLRCDIYASLLKLED